ncbi:hypothetical protein GL50803_002777 [Giardia duodenalis]|uniref:Uncharacterized protein n=1 Tax=Giardia intestinalis (strain ATCC 50803 / WB clone C6) TaxID=184922 RepID=D3KGB9_GIAIC|nr:hypothetical protein GL50803_002777 [Giardia intestinalis]KAE8305126.1 hypothetical protein GL50803_002777 [Giardia intestinalis]
MSYEPANYKTAIPKDLPAQRGFQDHINGIFNSASQCLLTLASLKLAKDSQDTRPGVVDKSLLKTVQSNLDVLRRLLACIAAVDHTTYMMARIMDVATMLLQISSEPMSDQQARKFNECSSTLADFLDRSIRYLSDLFSIH